MNTAFNQDTLRTLLEIFKENPALSQRALSERMSVSLGSANSYVQYCIRSGFLRKSLMGRTGYQLTDKGIAKRQALTAHAYGEHFAFGQAFVAEYQQIVRRLKGAGIKQFFIQGTGALSDLSYLSCQKEGVSIVGFVDPKSTEKTHLGLPVLADACTITPQQSVLFTDIEDTRASFQLLATQVGRRRIVVPPLVQELLNTKELML